MPASLQTQKVKLDFELKRFNVNLDFMESELHEVMPRVLMTGAAAYATSAQRHTPPSLGKPDIEPFYYEEIMSDRQLQRGERTHGRRVIYNLRALVRGEATRHFRSIYGKLLRQGYEYAVLITGNQRGRRHGLIPCTSLEEAKRLAVETNRGLMRAAWGLRIGDLGVNVPPAFRKYLSRRPGLSKLSALNTADKRADIMTIFLTNSAIPSGASFFDSTDANASIAAVKSMDDRMEKLLKKHYNL